MVVDLSGKQQNKIAWRWTKQMAMTAIRRKKTLLKSVYAHQERDQRCNGINASGFNLKPNWRQIG
jgi:hypothetical protein